MQDQPELFPSVCVNSNVVTFTSCLLYISYCVNRAGNSQRASDCVDGVAACTLSCSPVKCLTDTFKYSRFDKLKKRSSRRRPPRVHIRKYLYKNFWCSLKPSLWTDLACSLRTVSSSCLALLSSSRASSSRLYMSSSSRTRCRYCSSSVDFWATCSSICCRTCQTRKPDRYFIWKSTSTLLFGYYNTVEE